MLFVLVKQIVEDLLVEQSNTLKVVARPWLETNDLVNKSIRLMTQVSNVLLPLNFLFHICRIVTDLQFYCVK